MKLKIIILCIVVVIVGVVSFLVLNNKTKEIEIVSSNIKRFHFGYSTGYMRYSYTNYDLTVEDNKIITKIKPDGVSDEEALEIEVERSFLEQLTNILNKYQVSKWNGFKGYDENVMDGNSFSLSIDLTSSEDIYATGYMVWPKNYREVRNELDNLFMNLYNKNL